MTEKEKVIVSAYTGYLMCDFEKVHKYIEEILGRTVWTHEMAKETIQDEIREKSKADFIKLCESETPVENEPVRSGKWIHDGKKIHNGVDWYHCSNCGAKENGVYVKYPYCAHCGAKMEQED